VLSLHSFCRTYTFFQPKYILYTVYLSEKIGYWRYITIYRNLQVQQQRQYTYALLCCTGSEHIGTPSLQAHLNPFQLVRSPAC
jgi:hypothetical protein